MRRGHASFSHYRSSHLTGIPCAMVLTAYIVRAPARPAFVSPSPAHLSTSGPKADVAICTSLAPATRAPGPHAFAVRRPAHTSSAPPASIAFHPNIPDVRETPLDSRMEQNGNIKHHLG